MLGEILELFKKPVTTMSVKSQERNVKKEAITAAIIAVVIALVSLLTSYIGINQKVKKRYLSFEEYNEEYSYKELTKEEYKEEKKEYKDSLLENVKLGNTFFKTLAITAVGICLVAGILFIISRTVKSPKDYIEMLSMTNGAFTIYLSGYLLNTIFSYIYAPIGLIISVGTLIYAIISLSNAFRDSLEIENSDKLSMYATIVITVVLAILAYIVYNSTLGALSSGLDALDSLSSFSDLY